MGTYLFCRGRNQEFHAQRERYLGFSGFALCAVFASATHRGHCRVVSNGRGKALLGCAAINVVAVAAVVVARHSYPVPDIAQFIVFMMLYDIPHLFFGITYLRTRAGETLQTRPL